MISHSLHICFTCFNLTNAVGICSGLQPVSNEMSRFHGGGASPLAQQQGIKNSPVSQPHILLNASSIKGLMATDEFKYGFPSQGLSATTNKWWGSGNSDDYDRIQGGETETYEEDKNQPEEKTDDSTPSKAVEEKEFKYGKEESKAGFQGPSILTSIRRRIADEGQEALKLGVYNRNPMKKLKRKEKVLLLRMFGSSVPKEWIYDCLRQ